MRLRREVKLISARGLSVAYGHHTALEDVSLDIFSTDFIGIIGPNGGGKSSLIKALLGLIPYSGNIEFADCLMRGKDHRSIGYLPQQNNFDTSFPISVREVVLSGLQAEKKGIHRYGKGDLARADELLAVVGIEEIAQKTVGEVSGGQLQRALLCRALVANPKLLILDESANFVDNKFEKELYELLRQLNDKMAIIMVSHDLGTISSVIKTIVCVNKHVHRHDSNIITTEQLNNYDCPLQLISHGHVPHIVLEKH